MSTSYLHVCIVNRYLFSIALLFFIMGQEDVFASLIDQPMKGATAPGWVIGGSAYLTASSGADPDGNGWLRLTEPANDQAGYAFFDSPFDITNGAVVQFDYATWGGDGADGYSIYLFDSTYDAYTFSVGASGGSLGYAQKTVAPIHSGLSGGYIGVGVDEFGNYSNPTEGRLGGPGMLTNSVAVRGPYNHPFGNYYYVGGSATLPTPAQSLAFNGQAYRPGQTGTQYRKVIMYLTPVAAPNYLRVDVYLQFGAGQPLTQVVSGLNVGRPVPASVKVGYAASTGGQTNYHEIRNLLIDNLPTDINLAISKTASVSTVAPGASVTYTVKASNLGPNPITATNVPITDSVPAALTGVTWTCVGSGGATCSGGSGNNINTTATIPFNAAATYTISGTVNPATPPGTQIVNTATLTPPAGITDYNSADNSASATVSVTGATVSISGMVFRDNNHNGILDGGEAQPGTPGVYVKLFRSSDLTQTVRPPLAVTQATGNFTITNVPSNETYTIIISATNTTNVYDPSYPNASWIYTQPLNYTLTNVAVGSTNLTNQNFGVYYGSRISGRVVKDDGAGGGSSTANDGVLNGSETGIAGVAVNLTNSTNSTTYDTTTTDTDGNFALFTNTSSRALRIYETNPAGYLSVNYDAGNTAGTYTIAGEFIQFTYTRYANNATGGYKEVVFSDVPDNSFTPTPRTSNATPNSTLYYAHTFNPGSGGSLTLTMSSRTQGAWPAIAYYRDTACNGTYDAGDPLIPSALTVFVGVPVCILVKETIPAGATIGATDQIVTRASFSYPNSYGPVAALTIDVTDTTTVVGLPQLMLLKSANTASASPGQVITYTVVTTNTGVGPAPSVVLEDSMSSYSEFKFTQTPFIFSEGSPPSSLTLGSPVYSNNFGATFSYTPVDTGGGYDKAITSWRIPMTGTMNPNGANFSIVYQVRVK